MTWILGDVPGKKDLLTIIARKFHLKPVREELAQWQIPTCLCTVEKMQKVEKGLLINYQEKLT